MLVQFAAMQDATEWIESAGGKVELWDSDMPSTCTLWYE